MSDEERDLERLRRLNERVGGRDREALAEAVERRGTARGEESVGGGAGRSAMEEESIVRRTLRPVLAVQNDEARLVFANREESRVWKERLEGAHEGLAQAIPAVGRIDLEGLPGVPWVGTGWLVDEDILVTNRHVAEEFVARRGATPSFVRGHAGRPVEASVDFLHEVGRDERASFRILEVLAVMRRDEPDMAFFRVEATGGPRALAAPIRLASSLPERRARIAVIGYPAEDSRIPDQQLMSRIYGDVYDQKRLAPGEVLDVRDRAILHDCTTLGGNSGSVVLDLDRGAAVGLHFSGTFLTSNFAVRADLVRHQVEQLRAELNRRRVPVAPIKQPPPPPTRSAPPSPPAPPSSSSSPRTPMRKNPEDAQTLTVTIPLVVSIRVGAPTAITGPAPVRRVDVPTTDVVDDEEGLGEEASRASYDDRGGYKTDFLGEALDVPLPEVTRKKSDVLTFEHGGETRSVLDYEHFSVVMSRSRRMCFFSAVNIDGGTSKRTPRGAWRLDPRIPREAQIMKECYGAPPKFSRGHMTRREDPAWGDTATARRGSGDSMHVTNATPQMQSFNSPIWLALEDHALESAREDDMRISVFTGPFFTKDDPEMHGVRIPTSFWKVIAFVHDETGELCATGYVMEQDDQLPGEERVFGDFFSPHLNRSVQVPIAEIERRAGVSFGGLADHDPLAKDDHEESVGAAPRVLRALNEVRFV